MPKIVLTPAGDQRGRPIVGRSRLKRLWVVGLSALTTVVLAIELVGAQSSPLRAGEQPRAGTAAAPADFITESRNKLKALQAHLAGLANRALAGIKPGDEAAGDMTSQRLMVDSAKARSESARLVREAAEIALTEYAESVFKDEMTQVDGEIKLAQFELKKAAPRIKRAEERYAKIKQVTSGSTADLAIKWNLEDGVLSARLQERKARFGIEQAQSKLKVLVEYEKLKRIKELRSDVEKARSHELAKRATWELEQSKLKKLQDLTRPRPQLTSQQQRTLALLDRAIPIEEKLSAKLGQIEKDREPGDPLRKEVADLTDELQGIVDQARAEEAAKALSNIKSKIIRALRRPGNLQF